MNKEQQQISENVIKHLKEKSGATSLNDIDQYFSEHKNHRIKYFKLKHIIIGALKERKLIRDFPSNAIGLTEKGWDFKSFSDIKREKLLNKTKKNISFIFNIIFLIVTIILSIQNSSLQESNLILSKRNTEIVEKVTILEGKLNRLDAQLNYLLKHQPEKSPLDTIK